MQLEYIYLATSKTKKDLQKVSTSEKSPQIWIYVSCSSDVDQATGNGYIYMIRSIYMGIKYLNNSLSELLTLNWLIIFNTMQETHYL